MVCLVEVLSNGLDALLTGTGIGVARVEIIKPDAEPVTAMKVVDEAGVGLCLAVRIWMRKIDQIGAVGDAGFGRVDAVLLAAIEEEPGDGWVEFCVVPSPVVFEEQRKCVTTGGR